MAKPFEPRPLNSRERALIDFLLSVNFPGRDELRSQVDNVEVVGIRACGCGTVDLRVIEPGVRSPSELRVPIEAHSDAPPVDVLLFVDHGLLSMLELVFYDDQKSRSFPTPNELKLWARPARKPQAQGPLSSSD